MLDLFTGVCYNLWQAAGGRRQAAGGRRQAAGGRRQAAGGRRQAANYSFLSKSFFFAASPNTNESRHAVSNYNFPRQRFDKTLFGNHKPYFWAAWRQNVFTLFQPAYRLTPLNNSPPLKRNLRKR
jgi:hypothetical protein